MRYLLIIVALSGCAASNQFRQDVVTQHVANREARIAHKEARIERAQHKLHFLQVVAP